MGFIFVDDVDLVTIGKETDTIEQVITRQQIANKKWEYLLEITGGALKPTKCYWYLVDFKWTQGECQYVYTTNQRCDIQGEGEELQYISNLQVGESRENMGLWQNLDGDNRR